MKEIHSLNALIEKNRRKHLEMPFPRKINSISESADQSETLQYYRFLGEAYSLSKGGQQVIVRLLVTFFEKETTSPRKLCSIVNFILLKTKLPGHFQVLF